MKTDGKRSGKRPLTLGTSPTTVRTSVSEGAYWFRPGNPVRGGMPRMVRWPRKSSDQNITANEELALAA